MRKHAWLVVGAFTLSVATATVSTSAVGTFTTIDVPGATDIRPTGINDRGDIVGTYLDANSNFHGFLWTAKDGLTLIDVPGARETSVFGINDRGDIVGHYRRAGPPTGGGGVAHGFLLSGGTLTHIDVSPNIYTGPQAINARGTIVGYYQPPSTGSHSFLRDKDGTLTTFEVGVLSNRAQGINARGAIVGIYDIPGPPPFGNRTHGFLIDKDGAFTSIDVRGALDTFVMGINARGDIVGYYYDLSAPSTPRAFLLTNDGLAFIDVPGASDMRPLAINARGQIVGTYRADGQTHGFLYER
jgi:uncharacterized membrane protein